MSAAQWVSFLRAAHEPPAEAAHEAPDDDDCGDGDACDRARAEAALVDRGVRRVDARLLYDVAGDSAGVTRRFLTAHAVGDALDAATILRALHTLRTRQIVPREARRACLRTTTTTAL